MKQIILTTENNQIRAAVLEEGRLTELLDDTARESRFAGSIFKGKVNNVVPGIQAAFVDIGLSKNAFLYAGDAVMPEYAGDEKVMPKVIPTIENLFKEGNDVVVQIMREQAGNKGAKITTNLSVPGRYVVLLPGNDGYLGISRKIKDGTEKQRLYDLGLKLKRSGAGLIIRTLAEGISEKELTEDVENLVRINEEITSKARNKSVKGLLYSSSDPFSRLIRETIDEEVDEIIVDDGDLAKILRDKLREVGSSAVGKIWTDLRGDLFERYDIFNEMKKALQPKVLLKSGGYLVIEKTEALTAIDINTGKYTGDRNLQDTFLQLNLEAVDEISIQIRLRNLSGMIILDFIDMEKEEDWEKLLDTLEKSFTKDKVKCKVMGRTKLGLVEVTRKKEGQTLAARYTENCSQCGGRGWTLQNSH